MTNFRRTLGWLSLPYFGNGSLFCSHQSYFLLKSAPLSTVIHVLPTGRSSRVGGTPAYMSPEMFQGSFTEKCDLWSLGVVMFQLMTGDLPYRAENLLMQAADASIKGKKPTLKKPPTHPKQLKTGCANSFCVTPVEFKKKEGGQFARTGLRSARANSLIGVGGFLG